MIDTTIDRKTLKETVRVYQKKNNTLALTLFLLDYLLLFFGQYMVVEMQLSLKFLGCIITFIAIIRLFIIGHDACHRSFTSSKKLNYWVAQLAFLPSVTTYQGWLHLHNVIHHSYTNLITTKDGWSPLSLQDYNLLNKLQKFIYRVFRNQFGVFFYYILEIWSKKHYFPHRKYGGYMFEKVYLIQFFMVSIFVMGWLLALFQISEVTNQSFLLLSALGFILPFIFSNMLISLIVYLHHTHPNIRWYREQSEWMTSRPHVTTTVHLKFPSWISALLHHIMEHPAHHLDSNIPCYNLKAAQRKLEEFSPEHIVVQDFSWKWYRECTRICKLYDFENHEWIGFPKTQQ